MDENIRKDKKSKKLQILKDQSLVILNNIIYYLDAIKDTFLDRKEIVNRDLEINRKLLSMVEEAETKEQIRSIWTIFRDSSRNYDGYGTLLQQYVYALECNLLDLLAAAQYVNNKPNMFERLIDFLKNR